MDNQKKKILIFSLAYVPHIGGAEVAIKEITDRIDQNAYEFHMITNRYDSTLPKTEQVGNVLVHRIGLATNRPSMAALRKFPLHLNKFLYQWGASRRATKLHREHHYDGIWAMMAHSTGIPTARFKRAAPEVAYILTLQEGDPPEHIERKMRLFGKQFQRAFTRADVLQSISTFLLAWGKRMGFQGDSYVIPNGVDVARFSKPYSEETRTLVRARHGVRDDDVVLVTSSRLVHKNGIDSVIKALPLFNDNIKHKVKFLILGTGPLEKELKATTEALGLQDQVQFCGYVTHDELPKYLAASDIFIRPSRSEGMGASFVETMAAGIPVIATQVGGIADFLFDAKRNPKKNATGFAVDADSPEQIKEQVEYILTHEEEVKATVAEAKKMVEERYDWDSIAREMEEKVFSRVAGASGPDAMIEPI